MFSNHYKCQHILWRGLAIISWFSDITAKIMTLPWQSLLRLKEPAVLLRCREDDLHLVQSVLDSAAQEYSEKAKVHRPEILVDSKVYLPPAPSHHNAHGSFW